ncbi:RDD family protein [Actinomarinicola tropica]|uniref:RDD family protein n=1 Tax=Actinomarinicola tropica TaxID=2789776 RepID=UPI0018980CB7|nr:RDD family protein [Actinomarinicola tropica]
MVIPSDPFAPLRDPAPLGRRVAARAVDIAAVAVWVWAASIAHILYFIPRFSQDLDPAPWGRAFLFLVTFVVFYVAYEVLFTSRTGSTPGKDLMRLQVLDAHSGGLPSPGQAVRRALPLALVWLVPGAWPAVPLTAALAAPGARGTGRGVHDVLSGTRVVLVPEEEPEPGTTIEDARAQRRRDFTPRFVNPLQLVPSQMLHHPWLQRRRDGDEPGGGR